MKVKKGVYTLILIVMFACKIAGAGIATEPVSQQTLWGQG